MKMKNIAVVSCILFAATGCMNKNQCNDVVKETYIHNYGVPMAKADWEKQGHDGKVVQLKKDGITVTRSLENGVLNGETTYTFPNSSTIHRVEEFRCGICISKRENYPSGVPMREEIYEGINSTKFLRWYSDGSPASTECYEGSLLTKGEYRTPLNAIESSVSNGFGTRICRSSEGDLCFKDVIQNGQMVERITYFQNGDPSTITPYESENIHGMRLTYLPGGLPNTAEQWKCGFQDGITVVYQNGEKYAEVPYHKGRKNGVEYRFRDGSLLVEEVTWRDNLQHGERKIYVDGATTTEWYHQGDLVSRNAFERMNMPR